MPTQLELPLLKIDLAEVAHAVLADAGVLPSPEVGKRVAQLLRLPEVAAAAEDIVVRALERVERAKQARLLTDQEAADLVGTSLKTFRRVLDKHPELEDPTCPNHLAAKPSRTAARWPPEALLAWWHDNC